MQSSCFKRSKFSVELVSAGAIEGDAEAAGARHAPKSLLAVTTGNTMFLCAMSAVSWTSSWWKSVWTSPFCPLFPLCFAQDCT